MNINKILIFSFTVIYILHSMPVLGYRYPSMVYAAIVISLFLILLFNIGVKPAVKIIPIFLLPVLDVLITNKNMLSYFQGLSSLLQNMMLPMLAIYLCKKNCVKMAGWIFFIFIAINLITCFTTYSGCHMYPRASRDLAGGNASNESFFYVYMNANIGGFYFVYSQVLFFILTICTIKNYAYINKGKLICLIAVICLIGCAMAVVAAEYTIAILLTFMSFLLFFAKRTFNIKKIAVWCVSLLFVFLVFKPIIAQGLMVIANNTDSYILAHRLTDISLSIEGKFTQDNSDLDVRKELYIRSLTSFINHPLGCWNINNSGGHSYILDTLAKYGLVGVLLLIVSLRILYNSYIKTLEGTFVYGYAVVGYIVCIIMATFNPKIFTDFFLFVLPVYTLLFVRKTKSFQG